MASTAKLNAQQRAKIVARVSDVVAKNHIKPVSNWPALVAEHRERIIRAEDNLPTGARFVIELPAAETASVSVAAES